MANIFQRAREWAAPTLKSSAFLERGVLTPEEFVKAGDELVFKCPTWQWGSGDKKHAKSYLPADKQYLITRNVPCSMRVESMENAFVDEAEVEMPFEGDGENGADGEGWLVSNVKPPKKSDDAMQDLEDDFDVLDVNGEIVEKPPEIIPDTISELVQNPTVNNPDEEDDDDEYGDMEDFTDDNIIEDPDQSPNMGVNDPNTNDASSNILQTRTYDISITYDKYYQTPRVWIFGYREDGMTPLTPDEMFQDVMSDYVKRTVTIATHPHIKGVHASIHPCQHGAVMKNIVQNIMRGAGEKDQNDLNAPTVEMYLFIFLKFVSSIIPTINYDFTMEVSADTRKA